MVGGRGEPVVWQEDMVGGDRGGAGGVGVYDVGTNQRGIAGIVVWGYS